MAIRRSHVADEQVLPLTVGGRELVLWHRSGQASALDSDWIAEGK